MSIAVILAYLVLQNINAIINSFFWVLSMLYPFLIAIFIAFFLNVPLKAIEKRLFRPKGDKPVHPLLDKLRRPIALILSIIFFVMIIVFLLTIIIPELGKSLNHLYSSLPDIIAKINSFVYSVAEDNETVMNILRNYKPDYGKEIIQDGNTIVIVDIIDVATATSDIGGFVTNNLGGILGYTVNMVSSLIGTTINTILAIVISIYTLLGKERIATKAKKLVYGVLPEKAADFVTEIAHLTNSSFYKSITGQMVECIILGSIVGFGMALFGFPYAPLVGVIVAILSWIPMFGFWIGAGIGAVLVLTEDPIKMIWFLVFMVIVQQVEGNLIFPHVVGNSIGLPPLLMISAIVIFSTFFGIVGLIISCPVMSVIYTVTRRYVFVNLRKKKTPREKYIVLPEKPKPKVRKASKGKGMKGFAKKSSAEKETPQSAEKVSNKNE